MSAGGVIHFGVGDEEHIGGDSGGRGERTALLVADVVEYCRVVARRVEPSDLAATIEGDGALVQALLEASRSFAV